MDVRVALSRTMFYSAVKHCCRERKGPPEIISRNFTLRNWPISSADFPMAPMDPGRNYIRPPPPPPHFGEKTFFRERGGGVYFEAPPRQDFIRPPLLYPLKGYFQGWGGGGV